MIRVREIVDLIHKGNDNSESITFANFTIESDTQVNIIEYLTEHNCIKDLYDDITINTVISFSIDWEELLSLGVYRTKDEFVRLNQERLRNEFYIEEEQIFESSRSLFLDLYKCILRLRENLKDIASHCFEESGSDYIIISNNQQSVVVDMSYGIENFHSKDIQIISDLATILAEHNEKQKLYIAELVDYFINSKLVNLASLLDDFRYVLDRCNSSYELYLSDFSYNKLKLEIDSKTLEYTSKLQGVINDSQTKLIAIPTAFVLAATSLNFNIDNILLDFKNIAIIIGTLVFAILIQLFISNQLSSLEFIKDSINEYKKLYDTNKIPYINDKFKKIDKVCQQQHNRIILANSLLWATPIILILFLIIKAIQ